MTNNTEQRKTSEQAPREAFERTVRNWRGSTEGIRAISEYRRNCDEQSFIEAIWKAALAQREQEVAVAPSGAEPVYTNTEHGVTMQERNFSYEGNGWIQDNNFDYDAGWKVTGDFIGDDKDQYCQMICDALNNYTTPPQANNATEHPCDLLVAAALSGHSPKAALPIMNVFTALDAAGRLSTAPSSTLGQSDSE